MISILVVTFSLFFSFFFLKQMFEEIEEDNNKGKSSHKGKGAKRGKTTHDMNAVSVFYALKGNFQIVIHYCSSRVGCKVVTIGLDKREGPHSRWSVTILPLFS